MSSYSDRTLIVLKNSGKLSLYILGHLTLGVIMVPTLTILCVQLPAEYIITGDTKNMKAGVNFIENCKSILDKDIF
jgi:hypothetical protein